MATHITNPTEVKAHGNIPKVIREHVGRVNTKDENVSVAHMQSPGGWTEPGQTPEFDEITFVFKGALNVETKEKNFTVKAGESIIVKAGEWVRYSSPEEGGAEYVAVCLPAFSPDTVHRDE